MNSLGIAIKKKEIWYSVISGSTKSTATIIETGKLNFRPEQPTKLLMMDFHNIFNELIIKFKPDCIAYKLFLDADLGQIPYMHYSLGILNLICQQNGIDVIERSHRWITASKRSKIVKCEEYFSDKKFIKEEMEATLVAWYCLGE